MKGKIENGQVLEGKVTGIQPYGAFVQLDDDLQGLVHISEITNGFVKDIHEHVQIGETIKVKVLAVNEKENKISLSLRATEVDENQNLFKESRDIKENSNGFNSLKKKLQQWIDESGFK